MKQEGSHESTGNGRNEADRERVCILISIVRLTMMKRSRADKSPGGHLHVLGSRMLNRLLSTSMNKLQAYCKSKSQVHAKRTGKKTGHDVSSLDLMNCASTT